LPITDVAKSRHREHRLRQLLARWRLWAPALTIIVATMLSILSSPSFKSCMNSHSHGDGLRGESILAFRCTGAFVVDYSGAILTVAVGFIAIIIFVLWVYLSDILKNAAAQSELIRNSVDLTRAALVTAYPPALIFRGFALEERSFGEKQKIQVHFTVTNRGGTTATVTDIGAAVLLMQGPLPSDVAFAKRAVRNVQLTSGEAMNWPVASTENLTAAQANSLWQGSTRIVCVGYFTYRDDFGTIRNSGFCREYDLARRRWSVVADPDYEYAY
jgi:hypothetical protein